MKKPIQTQPEARKEHAERLKALMVELLRCTPAEYNEVQYREGLKYLKSYMSGDPNSARNLSASKVFWQWWRNHWTNRDESFICLYKSNPIRDVQIIRQLYTQYNDGKILATSISPNSVVLDETYAMMMTELVKGETNNSNQNQ
jgi:hypothetical protein